MNLVSASYRYPMLANDYGGTTGVHSSNPSILIGGDVNGSKLMEKWINQIKQFNKNKPKINMPPCKITNTSVSKKIHRRGRETKSNTRSKARSKAKSKAKATVKAKEGKREREAAF